MGSFVEVFNQQNEQTWKIHHKKGGEEYLHLEMGNFKLFKN